MTDVAAAPRTVSLPAVEPAWAEEARADPWLLGDIAYAVNGPFHVLYPQRFADNARAFKESLRGAGVEGQVYFGKKANKSACWLPVCSETGSGTDVASVPELADSLRYGVPGEEIVVTGAAKSNELLRLAARHGALVAVDALDELERLRGIAAGTGRVRLLLRVLPEADAHSRFGLAPAELEEALDVCAAERERLVCEGFSFHLGGYAVEPRARLAADLVDRCLAARERGLPADSVSIGGGFAVSYVDPYAWREFNENYTDSWFHNGKTFTHFYPYHQSPVGASMLTAVLDSPAGGEHATVGAKFAATGTRLLLEPGRALLDGAGFSCFPVQGYKPRPDHGFVTVNGLSMSVSEQWKGSEYLPDPVLWPSTADGHGAGNGDGNGLGNGDGSGGPVLACVGGASCMEYDMLTWRKVRLPRPPEYGDLLVYPNTAGYQMDKNETEFHQLPLPSRVVLSREKERFRWQLDR
nr:alanine racemase [Streptomyces sp. HNM0575]